jgi:hypothetical protein
MYKEMEWSDEWLLINEEMHRTMDLIILMFSSIDIVARVNKSTL